MAVNLIDVWNVETFDEDLIATLRANSELVRNYIVTDREIFLEREASGLRVPYRTNPHAESYGRFLEDLDPLMKTRTIRAWHYTRLTDTEVIPSMSGWPGNSGARSRRATKLAGS